MEINTLEKLTTHELMMLDQFLRRQATDMSLVKAHGFITAIVSFPDLFVPSEWIPILVGEVKLLNDQIPINIMLDKLIIIYRLVTANLSSTARFKFLLSAKQPDLTLAEAPYSAVQEWCNGYCLALVWNETEWLHAKDSFITKACATFFLLTDLIATSTEPKHAAGWQKDKKILVDNLPDLIKALYIYWLGEQKSILSHDLHSLRHDLCPCGSSRPYRICCLVDVAESMLH